MQGGGCSGLSYSLGLIDEPHPDWNKYDFEGVEVYVDQMSEMYLDGVIVDYVESLAQSGFSFKNPNVKSTCGCGSSFSV